MGSSHMLFAQQTLEVHINPITTETFFHFAAKATILSLYLIPQAHPLCPPRPPLPTAQGKGHMLKSLSGLLKVHLLLSSLN